MNREPMRNAKALFREGPDTQKWRENGGTGCGEDCLRQGPTSQVSWVGLDQGPKLPTLGLPRTAQQRVAL